MTKLKIETFQNLDGTAMTAAEIVTMAVVTMADGIKWQIDLNEKAAIDYAIEIVQKVQRINVVSEGLIRQRLKEDHGR